MVVHHKGRKKTTDAESGTAVGSVSQAALEDQVAKKKKTEIVGHGFYRFQRRDAQRSGKVFLLFLYPKTLVLFFLCTCSDSDDCFLGCVIFGG